MSGNGVTKFPIYLRIESAAEADAIEKAIEKVLRPDTRRIEFDYAEIELLEACKKLDRDTCNRILDLIGAVETMRRAVSSADETLWRAILDRHVRTVAGMEPNPARTIVRHVTITEDA